MLLLCSLILTIQICFRFFLSRCLIPIGNLDFIFGKHSVWPLSGSGYWIIEASTHLGGCLRDPLFLPEMLATSNIENKITKKTNNLGEPLLCPRWGHSYSTKGYTLLYAREKASLSSPSSEQWGPAWGNRPICMQLFAVSRTTKANQRGLNGG